jgi:hypothetical protein
VVEGEVVWAAAVPTAFAARPSSVNTTMLTRRTFVPLALVPLALVALSAGSASAALPPSYPKHPEGSILTGAGTPHAQYIIMKNKVASPGEETRQLFVLAAVRDVFVGRFNLRTRGGHSPRRGYWLTCLYRARFKGTTIYFASWARGGNDLYDSMKVMAGLINPRRWHGSCGLHARP